LILSGIVDDLPYEHATQIKHVGLIPSNARIRAALAEPCAECSGTGKKMPSGPSDAPVEECPICHGTGKRTIPGAKLEDRGEHLRLG
jgi:DnaJ-class molecular chaperone